jgi:vacuolar iron transporter family protein
LNDLDYLPDGRWPDEEYPPPNGRHEIGYAPPNGGRAPGYAPYNSGPLPAHRGPGTGPMPRYAPPDGRPGPGYPPSNGRHGNGYPPSNGSYGNGYSPPNGGRAPGYAPYNSGPLPAHRGPGTGPMPRYAPPDGRPGPGYPPPNGRHGNGYPPPNGGPAPGYPPSNGKRILAWLPYGQRVVLLPKSTAFDDGDEPLREHRDVSGGWLRPAVFGAMDGLVTNSSLIAGIGGGGAGHGAIVLSGIAGLIAGAFSMATGEYISVTAQNELTLAEVELERKQHARDPAGKLKRLTEVFIGKGVSPNLAEAVVRQISADRERAVATHIREDLGIDPDDLPSPRTAASASFAAFTVGALIPLSPFLLGYPVLKVALALAGVTAAAGGAAVAKLTGRSMLMGGIRQLTAAFLATGMAFVIGHLVGSHVA